MIAQNYKIFSDNINIVCTFVTFTRCTTLVIHRINMSDSKKWISFEMMDYSRSRTAANPFDFDFSVGKLLHNSANSSRLVL